MYKAFTMYHLFIEEFYENIKHSKLYINLVKQKVVISYPTS